MLLCDLHHAEACSPVSLYMWTARQHVPRLRMRPRPYFICSHVHLAGRRRVQLSFPKLSQAPVAVPSGLLLFWTGALAYPLAAVLYTLAGAPMPLLAGPPTPGGGQLKLRT